jgi:hypothetical protein
MATERIAELLERLEFATVSRVFPTPLTKASRGFSYHVSYGGSYWNIEPSRVKAGERVKLVEFTGNGRLEYLIMMVKMPNETPPDVEFVVRIDGKEIEDWTIYEAHELGMDKVISGYAGVLRYDTTNKLYSYFSYWLMWPFTRSLRVEVYNLTDVDVELVMWDVQYFARPE